jgi:hypothetical protein
MYTAIQRLRQGTGNLNRTNYCILNDTCLLSGSGDCLSIAYSLKFVMSAAADLGCQFELHSRPALLGLGAGLVGECEGFLFSDENNWGSTGRDLYGMR